MFFQPKLRRGRVAWKEFRKTVRGIRVDGDPHFTSTLRRMFFGGRKGRLVAIFQVDLISAREGYRVGYRDDTGRAMLDERVWHDKDFAVQLGPHPRNYFAVDLEGIEIPLTLLLRARLH